MTGTKEVGECRRVARREAARVDVQLLGSAIGPLTEVEAEKARWHRGLSAHAYIHESCNGRERMEGGRDRRFNEDTMGWCSEGKDDKRVCECEGMDG